MTDTKKKQFKNYNEYIKAWNNLAQRLPKGPFRDVQIDEYGQLSIGAEYFDPEEAKKIGKFILDFYGEPNG